MKFASLCLVSAYFVSTQSFSQNFDVEVETNIQNISSLHLLDSLRHIQNAEFTTVPKIQRLKTQKAVTTLFVERHDLPMVDLQLTFDAGSARDTEIESGLYGLANMTAKLMNKGTSKYNAAEIAQRFEDLGAQFKQSQIEKEELLLSWTNALLKVYIRLNGRLF